MDKKVLIVEDDPFIMGTIATKFQKSGYTVAIAQDAEQAHMRLAESLPDVILLDIILPNVNGIEFLKQIKSDSKTQAIPVVIFSNLGSNLEVKQAMDSGAIKYMIKASYTPSQVVEEINTLLSQ